MGKIISMVNNKGGVGKTTSTGVFAELIAFAGKKVLCIDLDESGNLSILFHAFVEDSAYVINGMKEPEEYNISELFKYRMRDKEEIEKLIKPTYIENVSIIPSSKRHKNTQELLMRNQLTNNGIILKRSLELIKDDYDFILIDNAPGSDILTVNSMFASDYILVPVGADGYSRKGLKETMESIILIKEEYEIDGIELLGSFLTRVDVRTNAYKDAKENYEYELDESFFKTPIRNDTKIDKVNSIFVPLIECDNRSNALFDYANLILETKLLDEEAAQKIRDAIS